MKYLLTISLLFFYLNVFSQKRNEVIGKYLGYFGTSIQLKADSTFWFEWHFDLSASWNRGSWKVIKDTIFLKKEIVYDTLILKNDLVTFIVSNDSHSDKIYKEYNLTQMISSGGQDRYPVPEKLFFKDGKLFTLRDGKILGKKVKGFSTRKKVPSWYVKEK